MLNHPGQCTKWKQYSYKNASRIHRGQWTEADAHCDSSVDTISAQVNNAREDARGLFSVAQRSTEPLLPARLSQSHKRLECPGLAYSQITQHPPVHLDVGLNWDNSRSLNQSFVHIY